MRCVAEGEGRCTASRRRRARRRRRQHFATQPHRQPQQQTRKAMTMTHSSRPHLWEEIAGDAHLEGRVAISRGRCASRGWEISSRSAHLEGARRRAPVARRSVGLLWPRLRSGVSRWHGSWHASWAFREIDLSISPPRGHRVMAALRAASRLFVARAAPRIVDEGITDDLERADCSAEGATAAGAIDSRRVALTALNAIERRKGWRRRRREGRR